MPSDNKEVREKELIGKIVAALEDGPMLSVDTDMGHFVKYSDVIRIIKQCE